MEALKFAKPRPFALEKEDRKATRDTLDKAESRTVKLRSQGQCEIHELTKDGVAVRCRRRAAQTHHMIGGFGRRGRGKSALAEHKQAACQRCHQDITRHVLQHIGGQLPTWTDRYRRIS